VVPEKECDLMRAPGVIQWVVGSVVERGKECVGTTVDYCEPLDHGNSCEDLQA
jgi:hypothetical protein